MQKISEENFSYRLREYRRLHGLTLKQLSERLGGVSSGFLSEVERGIKKPGSDLVFSFEKLTGEGEMYREEKSEGEGAYRHPDPTIQKIVELLEGMDDGAKEDILRGAEKEKLLMELMKERLEKKAG